MPLQVAVTVPPAATLVGVTLSVAPPDPTTLAGVTVRTGVGVSAESASAMRIRGLVTLPPGRVSVIGRPVLCRAERIWSTVPVGAACLRIAHAPATWGAAIDVPLATANPPPTVDEVID